MTSQHCNICMSNDVTSYKCYQCEFHVCIDCANESIKNQAKPKCSHCQKYMRFEVDYINIFEYKGVIPFTEFEKITYRVLDKRSVDFKNDEMFETIRYNLLHDFLPIENMMEWLSINHYYMNIRVAIWTEKNEDSDLMNYFTVYVFNDKFINGKQC